MAKTNDDDISPERLRQALLVAAELLGDDRAPTWPFRVLEDALSKAEQDDVRLRAARVRAAHR